MLNTQKYNLGKYNIAGGAASASGTVVAHSEMYGEPYVIYHASGSSHTIGKMEAAMPTRIVPITGNTIEATSDMEAQYYKRVEAIGTSADAVSGMTVQTAAVFGVDVLSLPELVLKPGQELIIDTDNMTATVDGENAIHLLSDESVFFFLAQGEDIITYIDNSNERQVNLKVMWKDRWL